MFTDVNAEDYTLQNGSPAVNAGKNDWYTNKGNGNLNTDLDLAGQPRLFGTIIDLGAYENQHDVVLPVTLINYTAKAEGNYAKLQWQTTSETNNKGFTIYRSGDDGQFEQIGEVPASQISDLTSHIYNYTDKAPLTGTNYYQLVQVDKDGKATELGVRTVTFNFQPLTFNLYPNPTDNIVNVTYESGKYNKLTLSDVNGKVLQTISLNAGESNATVLLGDYPTGTYLLRLSGDGGTETKKIVKR